MHFCIIGGGIVGLATAWQLRCQEPETRIVVLEKEPGFGRHQSTHNSGVLHAGLYYKPGSAKARLAVNGIRMMTEFCQRHDVAHEICGKLVIAVDDEEIVRLKTLLERGQQNGLRGLRWLNQEQLHEIEPHAAGVAAVHVPEEGIVDYAGVINALAEECGKNAVTLKPDAKVLSVRRQGRGGWVIVSRAGEFHTDFIINCAGLHCDRVAQMAGEQRGTRIVPFRGEYYQLKPDRAGLVRNLIYPVPDPTFPFLGVHFTRLIHGGVEAGPNAILATAREGYRKTDINLRDLADALTFSGLWRFMGRHRTMCWGEVVRSFSKRRFCDSLQRLVPEITESDLVTGGAGVRAQAMTTAGGLVQDFEMVERRDALHLLNAPSPAATAALAIGEEMVRRVLRLAAAN